MRLVQHRGDAKFELVINLKTAKRSASQFLGRFGNIQRGDRMGLCPLLAQSRHERVHCTCPLSGVKRNAVASDHRASSSICKRYAATTDFLTPHAECAIGSLDLDVTLAL